MRPERNCAPAGRTAEARGKPRTLDASVTQRDAGGKTPAVWLYNIGARSFGETQAAFARYPKWEAA